MEKVFNRMFNVGKAKYVLSYHDGKSKHPNGSDFFAIAIFKNKKKLKQFTNQLLADGYVEL